MLLRMQSIAPVYCGDRVDSPATWSFRRNTSKGWVKIKEMAPDNAPLPSFRSARLTSETLESCTISAGRMTVFTVVSDRLRVNRRPTRLVNVEVERDCR